MHLKKGALFSIMTGSGSERKYRDMLHDADKQIGIYRAELHIETYHDGREGARPFDETEFGG